MATLLLMTAALAMLVACDVHEFPDTPSNMTALLHLRFTTDMPQLEQVVNMRSRAQAQVAATVAPQQGEMRYIVRLYPKGTENTTDADAGYREYVFTRDVAGGYDTDLQIEAPVGQYTVAVWADLDSEAGGQHAFYSTSDFYAIALSGPHTGNTDYRDAFRGTAAVTLAPNAADDASSQAMADVTVQMERPLAKFEFVTDDVATFLSKQAQKTQKTQTARAGTIGDYRFVFRYYGYMPCTYSLFSDKPVDATTGISFEGRISQFNSDEASLGFDYVFVNHQATAVTVQLDIYDAQGTLLSTTQPINVPLQRSRHTIVRGSFLTLNISGGVNVKTEYDGEYNLIY